MMRGRGFAEENNFRDRVRIGQLFLHLLWGPNLPNCIEDPAWLGQ